MIYLGELMDIIDPGDYNSIMIVNKPYQKEHILYLGLDTSPGRLKVLLNSLDMAEVTKIEVNKSYGDVRGYYEVTKIFIDEEAAFFDLGDEDFYGSGKVDFYDIENDKASEEEKHVYNQGMGFYINKYK